MEAALYCILRRVLRKVLQNTTGGEFEEHDLEELELKRHNPPRETCRNRVQCPFNQDMAL
jgi:hypothetical protein